MQKSSKSIIINTAFILIIFFSGSHNSYADNKKDSNIKFLQDKLKDIIPNYKFDKIKKSPLDNMYEIVYGGEIIYILVMLSFYSRAGIYKKL